MIFIPACRGIARRTIVTVALALCAGSGAAPRAMRAELYLLDEGEYELTLAAGDSFTPLPRKRVRVAGPRTSIRFELPSRRLCTLRLEWRGAAADSRDLQPK